MVEAEKIPEEELSLRTEVKAKIFSPFVHQLLAVAPVTYFALLAGFLYGFSATLLPELLSQDSEIPITPEEASWIASIPVVFMALGCLICGPLVRKYGYKKCLIAFSILSMPSWVIVYFANSFAEFLIARALSGVVAGLHCTLFPAYIAEISEPKYRGVIGVGPTLFMTLGVFIVHVLGSTLKWRLTALFSLSIPVATLIGALFTPESPSWYITQCRYDEALVSFQWLRGNGLAAKHEFDETCEFYRQEIRTNYNVFWRMKEAFKESAFVKPFFINICLFFLLQFSGLYSVMFYSVAILQESLKDTMDGTIAMYCIDILRIFIVVLASILSKICRRRVLFILSCCGTILSVFGLGLILLAIKAFPKYNHFSWLSVVALVCYISFVTVGIATLPWYIAGELIPLRYRAIGNSFNFFFNFILMFFVIKLSPMVFSAVGMAGSFISFGVIVSMCTIILYYVLPETKNKSLVEIEKHFKKKELKT